MLLSFLAVAVAKPSASTLFKNAALSFIDTILLHPHSFVERAWLMGTSLFIFVLVLTQCQKSFNAERATFLAGFLSTVLIFSFTISAISSFAVYMPKRNMAEFTEIIADFGQQSFGMDVTPDKAWEFLLLGVGILLFIFIGGPVCQYLFKSGFLATIFSLLITTFIAACSIITIQAVFFPSGDLDISKVAPIIRDLWR